MKCHCSCPIAFTLNGDILESFERLMSETFKHLAVYYYGPYVKGHTIDLDELKKLSVNLNVKNRNQVYIKESPPLNLGEIKEITQNGYFPSGNFNVKEVGVSEKPTARSPPPIGLSGPGIQQAPPRLGQPSRSTLLSRHIS